MSVNIQQTNRRWLSEGEMIQLSALPVMYSKTILDKMENQSFQNKRLNLKNNMTMQLTTR